MPSRRWQIFPRGCSMIFEGLPCPVDRSWCAQRCCDGAATESLLRRSCADQLRRAHSAHRVSTRPVWSNGSTAGTAASAAGGSPSRCQRSSSWAGALAHSDCTWRHVSKPLGAPRKAPPQAPPPEPNRYQPAANGSPMETRSSYPNSRRCQAPKASFRCHHSRGCCPVGSSSSRSLETEPPSHRLWPRRALRRRRKSRFLLVPPLALV